MRMNDFATSNAGLALLDSRSKLSSREDNVETQPSLYRPVESEEVPQMDDNANICMFFYCGISPTVEQKLLSHENDIYKVLHPVSGNARIVVSASADESLINFSTQPAGVIATLDLAKYMYTEGAAALNGISRVCITKVGTRVAWLGLGVAVSLGTRSGARRRVRF